MIRLANINDLNVIVENNANLAFETEGITLEKDRLTQGVNALLLDESKGHYYVYEINKKVVGQLMITKEWSDWRNAYYWWIQSVYVQKDYRKKNVFTSLYQHIKKLVDNEPNVCGLRLYVDEHNKKAQAAYQKVKMDKSHYLLYEKNS